MLADCFRFLGLGLLAFASGCAMCGSCDDFSYGAYGGRWERLDPCYGRVGSAFTPEVGTRVAPYPELERAEPKPGEPLSEPPTPATPPGDVPPAESLLPELTPGDSPPTFPFRSEDAPPPPPTTVPEEEGTAQSADQSILRRSLPAR